MQQRNKINFSLIYIQENYFYSFFNLKPGRMSEYTTMKGLKIAIVKLQVHLFFKLFSIL